MDEPINNQPVDGGQGAAAVAEPPAAGSNATPVAETPASPDSDVMSALEAAMNAGLGDPEPGTATGEGQDQPESTPFDALLNVSEFVKEPGHVEAAVKAADEVWKVASGQLPAHQLLEGMRAANPNGFQAIVQDLAGYIEQVTGAKFGGQPQASPLDDLKAANPQAYEEISKYYQQVTGKTLGAPTDPRDSRLAALEERYAQEQRQREQEAVQRQIQAADEVAYQFLGEKLKGTFAEGDEEHFVGLLAQKLGKNLGQSMQEVLNGNTKSLENALKDVMRDESARVKRYNERLIANYRKMGSATPGVKGAAKPDPNTPARKEGETDIQYATRLWNEGK